MRQVRLILVTRLHALSIAAEFDNESCILQKDSAFLYDGTQIDIFIHRYFIHSCSSNQFGTLKVKENERSFLTANILSILLKYGAFLQATSLKLEAKAFAWF